MALATKSVARKSRYTFMGATAPTDRDGVVGLATDQNAVEYVQFVPRGAAAQAIELPAYATALVSPKVFNLDDIVDTFAQAGRLDALHKAVQKAVRVSNAGKQDSAPKAPEQKAEAGA